MFESMAPSSISLISKLIVYYIVCFSIGFSDFDMYVKYLALKVVSIFSRVGIRLQNSTHNDCVTCFCINIKNDIFIYH